MSRLTEQELTEILDENKGISMVNPNRVYPPLPPAENIMPLMRIPEQATLCEKIGGTGIYSDRTFPRGREGLAWASQQDIHAGHSRLQF